MQNKAARIFLAAITAVVVFIVVNAGITLFSSYSPKEIQEISLVGEKQSNRLSPDKIKILTFNTGHGALGEEADSKKEGGKGKRQPVDTVLKNTRGISEIINLSSADAVLLQDVDVDSHRSRYVDQFSYYLGNGSYIGAFARDYSTRSTSLLPPYNKVEAGLLTLSINNIVSAERVALPLGYSGPSSALNPKRAMLVTRFDIKDSDKKLVLINFEIDAYTSDKNREKQIKAVVDYAEKAAENGDYVVCGGSFHSYFDDTDDRYPVNDRIQWEPEQFDSTTLKSGWLLCYDASVPTARVLNKPFDAKTPYEERQVYVGDGILVSPNVEVKMVVTVDQQFRYSNHNPVLLEISLK